MSLASTPASTTWLTRDIFDHAGITERVDRRQPDNRLHRLDTHYRMHPKISGIPTALSTGVPSETRPTWNESQRQLPHAPQVTDNQSSFATLLPSSPGHPANRGAKANPTST